MTTEAAKSKTPGDWPTLLKDNARTGGQGQHPARSPERSVWQFRTGSSVRSAPILEDGILYVTSVTAQFMPARPDIADIMETDAKAKGLRDNGNQRVLDLLTPGDVLVVDLFGKIEEGTIVGDNLATYIYATTGTGLVVDGAIRDLEGI